MEIALGMLYPALDDKMMSRLSLWQKEFISKVILPKLNLCRWSHAGLIMYEACHFCNVDTLPEKPYQKKPFEYKFTWKPDFNDPMYLEYLKNQRARKFLDEVREAEHLFGEIKRPMFLGDEL